VGGKVEQNTAGTVHTAPIVEQLAQYTPSTDWTKKEKLQWRYAYLGLCIKNENWSGNDIYRLWMVITAPPVLSSVSRSSFR
jgi:hypothetical protein